MAEGRHSALKQSGFKTNAGRTNAGRSNAGRTNVRDNLPALPLEYRRRVLLDLVDAHLRLKSHRLLLAVWFRKDHDDLSLLEVLDGFAGAEDDPPHETEFPPSERMRILSNLRLHLASPAQVLALTKRGDELARDLGEGECLFRAKSPPRAAKTARELLRVLGVDAR